MHTYTLTEAFSITGALKSRDMHKRCLRKSLRKPRRNYHVDAFLGNLRRAKAYKTSLSANHDENAILHFGEEVVQIQNNSTNLRSGGSLRNCNGHAHTHAHVP